MERREKNKILKGGMAISLFFALVAAGCAREGIVWTETYSFPGGEWQSHQKITFIPDTVYLKEHGLCQGVVALRYKDRASLESLPVVIEAECPGLGAYSCDTISLRLLSADERTASNATMGVFETADTLSLGVTPAPGWNVTIYPLASLTGIFSLTFEIIKP